MSTIDELNARIKQFEGLKTSLESAASYASAVSKDAGSSAVTLDGLVEINGDSSFASKNLKAIENDMSDTSNYINNTVIPAIDSDISSCKTEISKIEAEIKKKAEEEAAAAKKKAEEEAAAKKKAEEDAAKLKAVTPKLKK